MVSIYLPADIISLLATTPYERVTHPHPTFRQETSRCSFWKNFDCANERSTDFNIPFSLPLVTFVRSVFSIGDGIRRFTNVGLPAPPSGKIQIKQRSRQSEFIYLPTSKLCNSITFQISLFLGGVVSGFGLNTRAGFNSQFQQDWICFRRGWRLPVALLLR
jgi:hypothetical protein